MLLRFHTLCQKPCSFREKQILFDLWTIFLERCHLTGLLDRLLHVCADAIRSAPCTMEDQLPELEEFAQTVRYRICWVGDFCHSPNPFDTV